VIRAHDDRDERGAVLVMFTIVLTVLVAFSALAIDLGYAREKKRQVQNAADAAALAAAQTLPNASSADSTAQSVTGQNLDGVTWNWSTCTDSQALVNNAGHACISFDTSYTQVRVRVPTITMPTFFARAIGFNSLTTHAAAVAGIGVAGFGTIMPFSMFTGGTGDERCLKSGSSNNFPTAPCNGPTTGNFGTLDVNQYGNSAIPTQRRCQGNGQSSVRLENNIAIGVDHQITVFNGTTVTDDGCPPGPNTIDVLTGNVPNEFDLGILHGSSGTFDDGQPARLRRGSNQKATVGAVSVDNKPLWEFIDPSATGIPPTCQRSGFNGLNQDQAHQRLTACFNDYRTGGYTSVLFGANSGTDKPLDLYDIQQSPRFAYVPTFAGSQPPNGASSSLAVTGFQPVFLQTLFGGCNGSGTCTINFDPGPWNTTPQGGASTNAEAVTAWVIPPTMLPAGLDLPWHVGSTADVELIK
jgi:hypothetical protein